MFEGQISIQNNQCAGHIAVNRAVAVVYKISDEDNFIFEIMAK